MLLKNSSCSRKRRGTVLGKKTFDKVGQEEEKKQASRSKKKNKRKMDYIEPDRQN